MLRGLVVLLLLMYRVAAVAWIPETPQPTRTATPTATTRPTPACCGDCDADTEVLLSEKTVCTIIFNSPPSLPDCYACDCNSDGAVRANEITTVLNNYLSGCPGQPTYTPTPTNTSTPTNTPTATYTLAATPQCCGDRDGDDVVQYEDPVACLEIQVGKIPPSGCAPTTDDGQSCDCDGNGEITVPDCVTILSNYQVACPGQPTKTPTPTVRPTPACCGDCDANSSVSSTELQSCLDILSATVELSDCYACDCNSDNVVRANELLTAQINNQVSCPGQPTKTPTPTSTTQPTPTPTSTVPPSSSWSASWTRNPCVFNGKSFSAMADVTYNVAISGGTWTVSVDGGDTLGSSLTPDSINRVDATYTKASTETCVKDSTACNYQFDYTFHLLGDGTGTATVRYRYCANTTCEPCDVTDTAVLTRQ